MAVARQPIPRVYGTPRPRTAWAAGRPRSVPRALDFSPGPVIAGTALACIFYLWGCAQVTQANYQKVQLTRQLQLLQAQRQLISSNLIGLTTREAMDAWARQHGMVPSGTDSIYVGSARKGM